MLDEQVINWRWKKIMQDSEDKLKNFEGDNGARAIFSIRLDGEIQKAKFNVTQADGLDNDTVTKEYVGNCPSASPALQGYVSKRYYEKKDWFIGGVSSEITESVSLTKSDNGWIQAR